MSSPNRWSKFWWQDWQSDPSLRLVSLAAQGLWMRMLCIAHEAEPYGHVLVSGRSPTPKELSEIIGRATERAVASALAELERENVFSRTADGTIYCRRMVRDKSASDAGREFGLKGGNPALNGKDHTPKKPVGGLTPPINPDLNTSPYPTPLSQPLNKKLEAEAEAESKQGRARPRQRPADLVLIDWRPSEEAIAVGIGCGFAPAEISDAADKMRDWVRSGGRIDGCWDARFRNWLRENVERRKSQRKGWDQNPVGDLQRGYRLPSFALPPLDPDDDAAPPVRMLQ